MWVLTALAALLLTLALFLVVPVPRLQLSLQALLSLSIMHLLRYVQGLLVSKALHGRLGIIRHLLLAIAGSGMGAGAIIAIIASWTVRMHMARMAILDRVGPWK